MIRCLPDVRSQPSDASRSGCGCPENLRHQLAIAARAAADLYAPGAARPGPLMNYAGAGIYGFPYRRKPGRSSRRESARLRRPAAVRDVGRARPGRAASFGRNEIARSLPGDDQRLAAGQLQLGPQPADVRADVFRLRLVPLAPDLA